MDHISDFLSRHLTPYLQREKTKEHIIHTILSVLGVVVLPEHITLRGGVCIISGHQSLKHQIFLKNKEILQALQQEHKTAHIKAIQ